MATVFQIRAYNKGNVLDDVSLKQILPGTLYATTSANTTDGTVSADLVVATNSAAGLTISYVDTLNLVVAFYGNYVGMTFAALDKCVAGSWTRVIIASPAYSSGATIKVIKSGTGYSLYYNGTQVGTTQTISDAGIISNTKHGIFSLSSSNTIDNFRLSR
jgi:hypothetical protein